MVRSGPFDEATNLAIIGPLTAEAIARLPDRFRQWALSPASAAFRSARTPTGWARVPRSRLDGAVTQAIRHVDAGADVAQLESLARRLDYEHFGVVLLVSSRYIAVSFAHRMSDGVGALAALEQILSGRLADEPRMSRLPALRALIATRQVSVRALRAGRDYLRAGHEALASAPFSDPALPVDGSTVAIAQFDIDSKRLAAITAAERSRLTDGSSVASTAVLIGVLFRAVRRSHSADVDLPLQMLVGLRRYLGPGWSTRGNFALAAVLGTTRGREWAATDYRDVVAPRLNDPRAVAWYLIDALVNLRARGARAGASVQGNPLVLSLSLITGRIGPAVEDYEPGEVAGDTLLMLTRGTITGPHCTIVATGSRFAITVIDDSGVLDIAGLERAFRAEEAATLGQ